MEIEIDVLEAALRAVFDGLRASGVRSVVVPYEYAWSVDLSKATDRSEPPKASLLLSVAELYDEAKWIGSDKGNPAPSTLSPLGDLIHMIGEGFTSHS